MRYIRKTGNIKVPVDPEKPYHTPSGTPSEVQELLRRGWVKKNGKKRKINIASHNQDVNQA